MLSVRFDSCVPHVHNNVSLESHGYAINVFFCILLIPNFQRLIGAKDPFPVESLYLGKSVVVAIFEFDLDPLESSGFCFFDCNKLF